MKAFEMFQIVGQPRQLLKAIFVLDLFSQPDVIQSGLLFDYALRAYQLLGAR